MAISIISLSSGHVKITDSVKNTVQYFQNFLHTADFSNDEVYIYKTDTNQTMIRFDVNDVLTPIGPWTAENLCDVLNAAPYFFRTTPMVSGSLAAGTTLHSTLRWNGTNWVEATNLLNDGNSNSTVKMEPTAGTQIIDTSEGILINSTGTNGLGIINDTTSGADFAITNNSTSGDLLIRNTENDFRIRDESTTGDLYIEKTVDGSINITKVNTPGVISIDYTTGSDSNITTISDVLTTERLENLVSNDTNVLTKDSVSVDSTIFENASSKTSNHFQDVDIVRSVVQNGGETQTIEADGPGLRVRLDSTTSVQSSSLEVESVNPSVSIVVDDGVSLVNNFTIYPFQSETDRPILVGSGVKQTNAALEVISTSQSFYPPRMDTTARNAMTPSFGAVIFNTTTNVLEWYSGVGWVVAGGGVVSAGSNVHGTLRWSGAAWVENFGVRSVNVSATTGRLGVNATPLSSSFVVQGLGTTAGTITWGSLNSASVTNSRLTDDGRFNIGLNNTTNNTNSVSIGNDCANSSINGMSIGSFTISAGTNRIVVGTGVNATTRLNNSIDNSIIFGVNSATASAVLSGNGTAASLSLGKGTVAASSDAILEMTSTTKGLLLPRMTEAQRDAIPTPTDGLIIYQTNIIPGVYARVSGAWVKLL